MTAPNWVGVARKLLKPFTQCGQGTWVDHPSPEVDAAVAVALAKAYDKGREDAMDELCASCRYAVCRCDDE